MLNILPCLQKLIRNLFHRDNQALKLTSKKFSDVEAYVIEDDSPSEVLDATQTKFIGENNISIFCSPSYDEDSVYKAKYKNLLINSCAQSRFAFLQTLENAYIDNTSDIQIFIGPCISTLFIRNCKNIKIKAITQQLRVEDSINIDIEAIVGVQPVLENCQQIRMSSLQCIMYEDLIWQMEIAHINPFENKIFQCYDFTPKKNLNYSFRAPQTDYHWERELIKQGLTCSERDLYLPRLVPMKISIAKRNLIEKNNQNCHIFGMIAVMQVRQLLELFSKQQVRKNIAIVVSLNEQDGLYYFKKQLPSHPKQEKQKFFFLCLKSALEFELTTFKLNPEKITIFSEQTLINNFFR